jgi:6-phospho-beta-glucosidase
VPAQVGPHGVEPVRLPPLRPLERALVSHVSAYEELALDAALRGGRERVFRALLAHPLIGQTNVAERLADELVARNQEFLAWT